MRRRRDASVQTLPTQNFSFIKIISFYLKVQCAVGLIYDVYNDKIFTYCL